MKGQFPRPSRREGAEHGAQGDRRGGQAGIEKLCEEDPVLGIWGF